MNDYEILNDSGIDVDTSILPKVIDKTLKMEKVKSSTFSIVLIDDEKMHEMNKLYRGIDRSTDVLSFAFEDNEKMVYNIRQLGEIFISVPKMKEQAKDYGHSETRELAFLTVHGLLHLLGYDHTISKECEKEMFERQELVLNEFKETRKS